MDTSKKKYCVLEWTIENFSCWNSELHDKVIKSTETCTVCKWWVDLYPRGLSGQDEHLVVFLHCSEPRTFLGELSFIGSDGSLLCTQQVDSKNNVSLLELPPGPKFEDVVSQIRKKEALHKDRLTIRWRQSSISEMVEYMCTTIDACDIFVKTSPKLLDYLSSEHKTVISWLRYPCDKEEMKLMILACAEDRNDCSNIILTLDPHDYDKNLLVRTRMTVKNNEDVVRTEGNEHLFRDRNTWVFCSSLTREEMSKEGFSLNLYLKIIPRRKYKHCFGQMHTFPEIHLMPTVDIIKKPNNSLTTLSSELMCLYQDQAFSDFQLKCDNISFPVHKNILSARSPVFKTMLSCDMREAASGEVDILDLDPSTLGLFLTYLYTGSVEELQGERAIKLYYAADKYQVPSLKRECVSVLCSNMSISNVCDILSLADKHHDDQLTSASHEFFLNNFIDILASEEWKSFMRSEPILALETVTHYGEKKCVKRGLKRLKKF